MKYSVTVVRKSEKEHRFLVDALDEQEAEELAEEAAGMYDWNREWEVDAQVEADSVEEVSDD